MTRIISITGIILLPVVCQDRSRIEHALIVFVFEPTFTETSESKYKNPILCIVSAMNPFPDNNIVIFRQ